MFKSKQYLTKHKKLYLGIKPFKCKTCEKFFSRKAHLQRHEVIKYLILEKDHLNATFVTNVLVSYQILRRRDIENKKIMNVKLVESFL